MSLIVPNPVILNALTNIVTPNLTMRIYGNFIIPSDSDSAASFTEISGGGYASMPLTFGNWSITAGSPSTAVYNATQQWTFTGIINAPGTIYGYFVTRDSDGTLMWAESFPSGIIPFSPIDGSIIKVLPLITGVSLF
jgi:hypothetical protein